MQKRYRVWLIAGTLAGLGLLGWALSAPSLRELHLADGRNVSLREVTYGTNHVHLYGPWWARSLAKVLPVGWYPRFGLSSLAYRTESPSLMVWTEWQFTKTNAPPNWAAIADPAGRFAPGVYTQKFVYFPGDRAVVGWNFSHFPRRSKTIELRWDRQVSDGRSANAGFVFANPARGPFPAWTPLPVPQIVTNGGLAFSLLGFVLRPPLRSNGYPEIEARFQVRTSDVPTSAWALRAMEVQDATGNRFVSETIRIADSADEIRCRMPGAYWPGEGGYRLRAHFGLRQGFAPDALWLSPVWPLPAPGDSLHASVGFRHLGASLNSIHLRPVAGGPSPPGHLRPNFALNISTSVSPSARGVVASVIDVVDDQNRPVRFEEEDGWALTSYSVFNLEVPAGAKAIQVRCALHSSRVVEFLATPTAEPARGARPPMRP